MNASFDGRPARFDLQSDSVVLIDPLALDGLAPELVEIGAATRQEQVARLAALGGRGLRIGLHHVRQFRPGAYQVDLNSFRSAEADDGPGVFDVDSGTVVVIDLSALARVAQALTWDRCDELLQAESGNYSVLEAINAEVGRPAFALISADAESRFSGDGSFQLLEGEPRRV